MQREFILMWKFHHSFPIIFLLAVTFLSGCQTTATTEQNVVISEEDSKLVFYYPQAARMDGEFHKNISRKYKSTRYSANWKYPTRQFPQASFKYYELIPGYHFPKLILPSEYIKLLAFGENAPITPLSKDSMENVLGYVRYQRFAVGETECMALTQTLKTRHVYSHTSSGDKLLEGHYCATTGISLTDDKIIKIIQSLGVKGAGIPTPSDEWLEARAKQQKDQVIEIPVNFNWPVFGANLTGKFLRTGLQDNGKIWISPNPGVECTGIWKHVSGKFGSSNMPQGEWSMLCNNGMSANGKYIFNTVKNVDGNGKDADNNPISFSFVEPS